LRKLRPVRERIELSTWRFLEHGEAGKVAGITFRAAA
jgi:uncharacterized protein YuzE